MKTLKFIILFFIFNSSGLCYSFNNLELRIDTNKLKDTTIVFQLGTENKVNQFFLNKCFPSGLFGYKYNTRLNGRQPHQPLLYGYISDKELLNIIDNGFPKFKDIEIVITIRNKLMENEQFKDSDSLFKSNLKSLLIEGINGWRMENGNLRKINYITVRYLNKNKWTYSPTTQIHIVDNNNWTEFTEKWKNQIPNLWEDIQTENSIEFKKVHESIEYVRKLKAEQLEKEKQRIEKEKKTRKFNLEYSIIFLFILVLLGLVFTLGFIKVPYNVAEGLIFFTFLILFEFLLVLTDPYIEMWIGEEPINKLFANAFLAGLIFPIHSFFENLLKKRLLKK